MTNKGGDPWDQGPCVIEYFVLCLHVSVSLVLCFMLSPASLSVSLSLSVLLSVVCVDLFILLSVMVSAG